MGCGSREIGARQRGAYQRLPSENRHIRPSAREGQRLCMKIYMYAIGTVREQLFMIFSV